MYRIRVELGQLEELLDQTSQPRAVPGRHPEETAPILTSLDDIRYHESLGHLVITPGSCSGGPPVDFECPLLLVKGQP